MLLYSNLPFQAMIYCLRILCLLSSHGGFLTHAKLVWLAIKYITHLKQGDQVESNIQKMCFCMWSFIFRIHSFIQSKKKAIRWQCSMEMLLGFTCKSVGYICVDTCLDSAVYLTGLVSDPCTSMVSYRNVGV